MKWYTVVSMWLVCMALLAATAFSPYLVHVMYGVPKGYLPTPWFSAKNRTELPLGVIENGYHIKTEGQINWPADGEFQLITNFPDDWKRPTEIVTLLLPPFEQGKILGNVLSHAAKDQREVYVYGYLVHYGKTKFISVTDVRNK